jgi:16S rRNA G1207 methylase RsmC
MNFCTSKSTQEFKNPPNYEFFPTPPWLVEFLHNRLNFRIGDAVLDPAAGRGNLLPSMAGVKKFAFEIDSENLAQLNGVTVLGTNFLQALPQPQMDFVLLNPPFSLQTMFYPLAFSWLKSGGILLGIASRSPWDYPNSRRHRQFLSWLRERQAKVQELPLGCFLNGEISAHVETCVISISKF